MTTPNHPLSGWCGRRFMRLCGITQEETYDYIFVRRNLLNYWPGRRDGSTQGDRFPMIQAHRSAVKMRADLRQRRVIMWGAGVARAFGVEAQPYCEWRRWQDGDWWFNYSVIPHPTGRNRWYNDPVNRLLCETFLRTEVAQYLEGRRVIGQGTLHGQEQQAQH